MAFMIGSHYIGDIELRVAGNPENLNAAVRRTLADIDPNLTNTRSDEQCTNK
jgi:hypothetical protein